MNPSAVQYQVVGIEDVLGPDDRILSVCPPHYSLEMAEEDADLYRFSGCTNVRVEES